MFGNGYTIGVPILGTTSLGAPALGSPNLYSGVITVLYADGATVVLSSSHVNLELCSTTCVTVATTLKQTAPGTYAYTFTPPSLTGTVTIYVQAGSLADDNGRIFPSVNTQIGTYASPAGSSPGSSSATSHPSLPATAPNQAKPASEVDQAVQAAHATQASPVLWIVAVLSALVVAACLILRPWRH